MSPRIQNPNSRRQRIVRDGLDQTKLQRFFDRNALRRKKHFERPRLADQTREPLRAAPARHNSQIGARMCEQRGRRGDPMAAGEREIERASKTKSIYSCNCRGRVRRDPAHQVLATACKVWRGLGCKRRNFSKIGSRRENVPSAAENQCQWRSFTRRLFDDIDQLFDHGHRKRASNLEPVEAYDQVRSVPLDNYGIRH